MAQNTIATTRQSPLGLEVPRFRAIVTSGVDSGAEAESVDGRLTIGTAEGVALKLRDPTVSRFHVELEASPGGIVLRDLGSTNGTVIGALTVREVVLRDEQEIRLGHTHLRIALGGERTRVAAVENDSYGALMGGSAAMRAVYSVLERAAPTNAPVLVTGESGTGKELAARAIHGASPRAKQPFEVVDCGGLPPTLAESELFGHERGAFTGALTAREGAFERANGGTLFLDELGELPIDVQPKLLRVLAEGEIRRVGGRKTQKVDVRIVAATNRDLRRQVNAGHFRADLFYRLAVIEVRMPALRERLEDLPMLIRALLERIGRERGVNHRIALDADFWAPLANHTWPGNVRELRNYLEQLVILQVPPPLEGQPATTRDAQSPASIMAGLADLPMHTARNLLLERFEREYITALLDASGGNVAEAARRAGVDRGTLFRAIRRLDLKRGE